MAKPGRGSRRSGGQAGPIHPPHQRGKRVSREELDAAIEQAPRSRSSMKKVLSENRHAIDKVRYFRENPHLPDAADREASASGTEVLTTNYIERGLGRGIKRAEDCKRVALGPRQDKLKAELQSVFRKAPDATAKEAIKLLKERAGVQGSSILMIESEGVRWIDGEGRERVTTDAALASRWSRLRAKPT